MNKAFVPAGIYKAQICNILEKLDSLHNTSGSQELSLVGNQLTLSDGGGFVDLSQYLDDQTITNFTLSGNLLKITIADGNTKFVDLSPALTGERFERDLGDNEGWVTLIHKFEVPTVSVTAYVGNEPRVIDWEVVDNNQIRVKALGNTETYKMLILK